jgi:hypothetical protein
MASDQDLCVRTGVMRIGPNTIRGNSQYAAVLGKGWSAATELGGAAAKTPFILHPSGTRTLGGLIR